MALTAADYTQGAGQKFMDSLINPATLAAGTLVQRFDPKAFPKVGKKVTGTDANGYTVPKPARTTHGAGS